MTRDEIEALCDEIDRLEIPFGLARPVMLATSALRALVADVLVLEGDLYEAYGRVAELRADKERLDWIQGQVVAPTGHIGDVTIYTGSDLRAALDAARAGENTP